MGKVTTALTMSVDGYIAGPDDGPDDGPGRPLGEGGEALFDWYRAGDTPGERFPEFRMPATSARVFERCARAARSSPVAAPTTSRTRGAVTD